PIAIMTPIEAAAPPARGLFRSRMNSGHAANTVALPPLTLMYGPAMLGEQPVDVAFARAAARSLRSIAPACYNLDTQLAPLESGWWAQVKLKGWTSCATTRSTRPTINHQHRGGLPDRLLD